MCAGLSQDGHQLGPTRRNAGVNNRCWNTEPQGSATADPSRQVCNSVRQEQGDMVLKFSGRALVSLASRKGGKGKLAKIMFQA